MVKLQAHPCPIELTPELQASLTAEYLADTSKRVWNKTFIKQALMVMSHGKCCYCECKIGEESKYLEVEHFQPKSIYLDQVMAWSNLLPACKRCNGTKGNHDTLAFPIVHPVNDQPSEHLLFRAGWFKEKTTLGAMTLKVVDLNNLSQKMVEKRYEIGQLIAEQLDKLEDMAIDYQSGLNNSNSRREKLIHWLKSILISAQPQHEYAAAAATFLLNEPLFLKVKTIFHTCHLWDDELARLEAGAKAISLDLF
jgi:hypothetical protein